MSSSSDSADSAEAKAFKCRWINHLNHRVCQASFAHAAGLRRHELRHQRSPLSITFIHQNSSSNTRRRSIFTPRDSHRSSRLQPTSTPALSSPTMGPGLQNPRPTSAPASGSRRPFTPTSAPIAGGTIDFPGLASLYDGTWQTPLHAANSSPPTSPWPRRVEPYLQGNSAAASNGSLPDHQSTSVDRSGLQQATAPEERRPALPQYEPRMSKTVAGQPRALDWLTEEGKVKFTEVEDAIHSQWGRSNHYRSTCLLLCEDWRHSDPLDLMALFSPDNMPPVGSPRAKYSYKDHGVAFTRAKVWFESVNRTAGNLDVYLNTGPFKPMDASHLCHQEHCIIHVVYEPAHINHDRSQCCSRAKFLRSEGKDVPELCSIHLPPCLMQVRTRGSLALLVAAHDA